MTPLRPLFAALFVAAPATLLAQQATWVPIGDANRTAFAVSPDYAQDGRIWSAYGTSPVTQARLDVSTDRGDSFSLLHQFATGQYVLRMAVSPTFAQDQTLFQSVSLSGLGNVLHRSTDAGASWTSTPTPYTVSFTSIRLSPAYATDSTLFACQPYYSSTAYRSTNAGQSWTQCQAGGFGMRGSVVEFAPEFASTGVAYGWNEQYKRLYRSTDGGLTFSLPSTIVAISSPRDITAAPVGPGSQRVVFAAGIGGTPLFPSPGLYRSVDDGVTWAVATTGLPVGVGVYRVVTAPDFAASGRVWLGTNQGVWVSYDHGVSYAALPATGLPAIPIVDLQLGGGSDGDLIARAATGVDGPGQLYRLRLSGTGGVDLGDALAGVGGDPRMQLSSPFGPGASFSLELAQAIPNGIGVVALGLSRVDAPFAGGVVVPTPELLLVTLSNAAGDASMPLQWPVGAPAGLAIFAQAWWLDAAGPAGFSASNAMKLTRL